MFNFLVVKYIHELYPPGNHHISHQTGNGKLFAKIPLGRDMLVPRRVHVY